MGLLSDCCRTARATAGAPDLRLWGWRWQNSPTPITQRVISASASQETVTRMPFSENLPPAVRRSVEQLSEASTPVVNALRDAATRAGETARTLAYAYVGVLDLAQEQLLRAARFSR